MASASTIEDGHQLPVDRTIRLAFVFFRILGWAWLVALIALTPSSDPDADRSIMIATVALATIWTAVTVWAGGSSGQLGVRWFLVADLAIALAVGAASTLAGAEELFHGGYPTSTLGVVAYGFGFRGAIFGSVLLGLQQVWVNVVDDRSIIPAAGIVAPVVVGILLGWGVEIARRQDRQRLAVQGDLDMALAAQVRHEERLELADRLHGLVLQTLVALRRDADDPDQVRFLARYQERQLRRTISEYRSTFEPSSRAAVEAICDQVEDLHRLEIEAVIRGDAELGRHQQAVIEATHEALTNAAKHSGASKVDLYAEFRSEQANVFVRDRGTGFNPDGTSTGRGMEHGIRRKMEAIGGLAKITTSPEGGTEVALSWGSG